MLTALLTLAVWIPVTQAELVYRLNLPLYCKGKTWELAWFVAPNFNVSSNRFPSKPFAVDVKFNSSIESWQLDIPRTSWSVPAEYYTVTVMNPEICVGKGQHYALRNTYSTEMFQNITAQPEMPSPTAFQVVNKVTSVHFANVTADELAANLFTLSQDNLTVMLPALQVTDSTGTCARRPGFRSSVMPPDGVLTDRVVCVRSEGDHDGSWKYVFMSPGDSCTTVRQCPTTQACVNIDGGSTVEWLEQSGVNYPESMLLDPIGYSLDAAKQQCLSRMKCYPNPCNAVIGQGQAAGANWHVYNLVGNPVPAAGHSAYILQGSGIGQCLPLAKFGSWQPTYESTVQQPQPDLSRHQQLVLSA